MRPSSETGRPKLVVPLGRGSRGKSFLARWIIERTQTRGGNVLIADLDRTNASLSSFFSDVVSPGSADDRDVEAFFAALVEKQIEERIDVVVDFGGGDLLLKRIAKEIQLVDLLTEHGIEAVALHVIGPDRDDLAYLDSVERDQVFAPPATILVLNEALCPPHRTAHALFEETIHTHEIFRRTLERGGRLVRMPRLQPADEITLMRASFEQAELGAINGVGVWKRQQVAIWRRDMERAFSSVLDWLP